ncbi:glycosyltransferase [Spirosoma spitsbergense]|uniref:glycosyltransferase n=1 Tax=Spirosoma spitsbergense TaxID=431554 RepID=UPI00035D4E9E|nr:glycosyltransferase [Spirosoma spitsbergense]
MHQPQISIIITVLNGGKTLNNCLQSIAEQTFLDYELIIVDGGSNDNTLEIINKSNGIVKKVVSVRPDIGLYAGLNVGVELSIGKWLYFIGADDKLYNSDTLLKVSEIINVQNSNTKVIVGSVDCVKQKKVLVPLLGSPYLMRHQVHHQGMFYEKNIFTNFSYTETMRIASDYEFNLRLALNNVPHKVMDVTVCSFGGDGISENQFRQGYAEMQQVHSNLFRGAERKWVMSYFWLRRMIGFKLRQYNLSKVSTILKRLFG